MTVYARRLSLLRKTLKERALDAVLVSHRPNIAYLSGFAGSTAHLLILKNAQLLLTDFRYREYAEREITGFALVLIEEKLQETFKTVCRRLGLKKIGFESEPLSHRTYTALRSALAPCRLEPTHQLIEKMRIIKDEAEIRKIRIASRIACDTLSHIRPMMKPGMREEDLAIEAEYHMRKSGAERAAFDIIVASGPNSAMPHAHTSGRRLRKNEIVLVDLGACYKGYHSDLTRVFFSGKIKQSFKCIYNVVLEAQQEALRRVRPGAAISDIDKAARDCIEKEGFGKLFGHGLGHGLGLEIHELPVINSRAKERLEPGMVFTIEPGVYKAGRYGIRLEDVVAVTQNGCSVLTDDYAKTI